MLAEPFYLIVSLILAQVNFESKLLDELMMDYNRHARPIADVHKPIDVTISMYLTKILNLVSTCIKPAYNSHAPIAITQIQKYPGCILITGRQPVILTILLYRSRQEAQLTLIFNKINYTYIDYIYIRKDNRYCVARVRVYT